MRRMSIMNVYNDVILNVNRGKGVILIYFSNAQ